MSDLFLAVKQWLLTQLKDPGVLNAIGGLMIAGGAIFKDKFVTWSKNFIDKRRKKHKIEQMAKHAIPEDFATKGKQVNKILSDLRTALDCSRVAILQFRNGALFTLSQPIFRVYGSYESIRNGVVPSSDYFQEKIGTNLMELLGPLLNPTIQEDGVTHIPISCDKKLTCTRATCPRLVRFETEKMAYCLIKFMLEAAGVRVMYATPLMSGNSYIGAMVMHYLVNSDSEELIDQHKSEICKAAGYINTLLDIRSENN